MKCLYLIPFIFSFLFSFFIHAETKTITVNYMEGQNEVINPLIQLMNSALKGSPYKLKFVAVPSPRGLAMLKEGLAEVELARIDAVEKIAGKNYIRVKNKIGMYKSGFYFTNPIFKDKKNIDKSIHNLGVVRGSQMAKDIAGQFNKVSYATTPGTLRKMLIEGRIDLFVEKYYPVLANDESGKKIYFLELETFPVYTYVRSDLKEIVPILEKYYQTIE